MIGRHITPMFPHTICATRPHITICATRPHIIAICATTCDCEIPRESMPRETTRETSRDHQHVTGRRSREPRAFWSTVLTSDTLRRTLSPFHHRTHKAMENSPVRAMYSISGRARGPTSPPGGHGEESIDHTRLVANQAQSPIAIDWPQLRMTNSPPHREVYNPS